MNAWVREYGRSLGKMISAVFFYLISLLAGHIQGVDLCDAQSENDVAEGPGQA